MKAFIPYIRSSNPIDTFPLGLTLRRIYILPTKQGILFFIVLLTMLIGSMNYNNNLGFLLTFLLGSIAFVSITHTVNNLNGLTIYQAHVDPVFAGDTAIYAVLIRTNKRHRSLNFQFAITPDQLTTSDLSPSPSGTWVHLKSKTSTRGTFKAGPLIVWTTFPFGWFRSWIKIKNPFNCWVYPKPIPGDMPIPGGYAKDEVQGSQQHTVAGNEDFQGLKLYQPGDRLNRIAWKAYSQGQGLFTKVFEGTAGGPIILDLSRLSATELELQLSQLCWMILQAQQQNKTYGLKLPGVAITPGKGHDHKHNCLKALARYETNK